MTQTEKDDSATENVTDIVIESGTESQSQESEEPPSKKRKQPNPEKSHVEDEPEDHSMAGVIESVQEVVTEGEEEVPAGEIREIELANESQQMQSVHVIEPQIGQSMQHATVVTTSGHYQHQEILKGEEIHIPINGDNLAINELAKKGYQIRIASNVQATQPVQQPTIFTKLIHMKTEPNVGIDSQDDDEGVTLTAIQDKTIHELPQGMVVTSIDQNGNGNGQDMVTVLQQQFVQMPRSEAFRLGYIHPQLMMPSIGGVSGGIMAASPQVFAVQPQTNQLMTIGTNQIANQTQVVVQQSDLNTCDKIDESEKMAENNEIQELIKKAVTSKSLEVLTEAEAQILVDSQTCRPVTLRANYKLDDSDKKFKCIFCPLLTSLYKKEIRRSFNTKESLRRHYEQHFNHGLHSHQCAMKLADGTRCTYSCKRSDHLDRHMEKIHNEKRENKGKQNRRLAMEDRPLAEQVLALDKSRLSDLEISQSMSEGSQGSELKEFKETGRIESIGRIEIIEESPNNNLCISKTEPPLEGQVINQTDG